MITDLNIIFSFILASVILTLLPGPDIIFVLSISMIDGKKSGIITSFGLCSGLLLHTTAAALGISALIYNSTLAFTIVKYIGVIYLIYLAIITLIKDEQFTMDLKLKKTDKFSLYKRGVFMNILNPKVSLFFIAFLPQFIKSTENVPLQMVFLGFIFFVQAIIIFICVSVASSYIGNKIIQISENKKYVNWIKAAIYALIGIELAFSNR